MKLYNQKLGDRIADALRKAIIIGDYKPGERLREDKIAESYETSRTPVREAFRQLEAEGLVELRPRRGAVVSPITAKDIQDYYELQGLLASYAAKRAVYHLTDEDLDKMEGIINQLESSFDSSDSSAVTELHNQFHEIVINACGNDRIFSLVQNMINQFQRFSIALQQDTDFDGFVELHRELVKAFRTRDTKRVEFLVAKNSGQNSVALLRKLPNT